MPKLLNCNPQSLYNKSGEFITSLQERDIDVAFISESWERPNWPLSDLLSELVDSSNYSIVSNAHQRNGKGGRPALIVNTRNYHVQNLTQSTVAIPWGCEIVWCSLTPKNIQSNSVVKKIICAAIYSKPNSRNKTKLLDHITDTFNFLSSKYKECVDWILAGDTNELKLAPILNLDPRMKQIV